MLCVGACGGIGDPFAERLRDAKFQTIPAGSELLEESPPNRGDWKVEAHWSFRPPMEWQSYTAWLDGRLRPFDRIPGTGETLTYRERVQGDLFHLELRRVGDGSPLIIAATLRGMPD